MTSFLKSAICFRQLRFSTGARKQMLQDYLLGACQPVGCLSTCWVFVYLSGARLLVGC